MNCSNILSGYKECIVEFEPCEMFKEVNIDICLEPNKFSCPKDHKKHCKDHKNCCNDDILIIVMAWLLLQQCNPKCKKIKKRKKCEKCKKHKKCKKRKKYNNDAVLIIFIIWLLLQQCN